MKKNSSKAFINLS